MKTRVVSALVLMSMSMQANNVTRSFFSVRPFAQSVMVQDLTLNSEHMMGHVEKKKSMQFTAFGSQSTKSKDLAQYFFQGKETLRVSEAAPQNNPVSEVSQDILSIDFNLDAATNYVGEISIKPRQQVIGGSFSLRGYFGKEQQYNFAVEVPVLHVKNDLRLTEKTSGGTTANTGNALDGAPVVGNMIDAFKQKAMKYGRIDGAQKKSGVGDVVVKLGYEPDCCQSDDRYMNVYLGGVLPTSNKPKAIYMFEPMLGNNQHGGLMLGTDGHALVKTWRNRRIWVRWNMESQYLFENTQKRSFDLYGNGPWSRYLQVYTSETNRAAGTESFGINSFTLDAKVRPGYQGLINTNFVMAGDKWHASVGMSTNIRQGEKVKLAQTFSTAPYLAAYTGGGDTNRFRACGKEFARLDEDTNTGIHIPVKQAEIDLESASHPAGVTQVFYATLGGYKEGDKPRMFELGGSYEYSQFNTGMNRWGVWGTLQISF